MKKKLLITACVIFGIGGVTLASATFWYQHYFHARPFQPVHLTQTEQTTLDRKVEAIKATETPPAADPAKTLRLSEREINGYLEQQGLGDHLKVSIGNGSMNATALLPVDKDVPFIGGHTVRVKIALSTRLDPDHRIALCLSDLSIGGISAPNAWLGGIKGKNLLEGDDQDPLLKGLSEGIKDLQVADGEIRVVLND